MQNKFRIYLKLIKIENQTANTSRETICGRYAIIIYKFMHLSYKINIYNSAFRFDLTVVETFQYDFT